MSPIELSLLVSRLNAVCEEMGAVLRRSAFSPNIRDRLDFSCAVFDAEGELCAQAAHIPVHLGSMAYAMHEVVAAVEWAEGDMVVMNDPYLGGTHLPDVTVIAPVYVDGQRIGFVANRAHHADIGAAAPGSMPITSSLAEEGLLIPPTHFQRAGQRQARAWDALLARLANPAQSAGDFSAQFSANEIGIQAVQSLAKPFGAAGFAAATEAVNAYAARLAASGLADLAEGSYCFTDYLDDDGLGNEQLPIKVKIDIAQTASGPNIQVDFTGSAAQTAGNVNCPLSVTAAGVLYAFRCLMPANTPATAGAFQAIQISAPEGCMLNARRPAAVAAGNVETSTRVVDAVLGALAQAAPQRIPAASHGSMNNLAMGARDEGQAWDYYETMGGGMGASATAAGLSGLQTHMTNTLNTPIEVLEMNYPLRVTRYALRHGSGGKGQHGGGEGLIRELAFLAPAEVCLLTERRINPPWGLQGGEAAASGENRLNGQPLPPKVALSVKAGDVLQVASAGGGGWGAVRETKKSTS